MDKMKPEAVRLDLSSLWSIYFFFFFFFFLFFFCFMEFSRHCQQRVHLPNRQETGDKKERWAAAWQNQQCGCVSSEDSDQPGHPPGLIRVFAVRMKKLWVLSYLLSAQWRLRSACASREDSDQTGRTPRLIWVFAGRTVTLLVLSCRGSDRQGLTLFLDSCIFSASSGDTG